MNAATIDNEILTAAAFLAIGWDEKMQANDTPDGTGKASEVKERWGMGMYHRHVIRCAIDFSK